MKEQRKTSTKVEMKRGMNTVSETRTEIGEKNRRHIKMEMVIKEIWNLFPLMDIFFHSKLYFWQFSIVLQTNKIIIVVVAVVATQ